MNYLCILILGKFFDNIARIELLGYILFFVVPKPLSTKGVVYKLKDNTIRFIFNIINKMFVISVYFGIHNTLLVA